MDEELNPSPQDIERVGRFLDGISRGSVTELSQLLGQHIAYWRFKNAVDTALKAQRFLESRGLTPQKLSAELRVIVPLIESASYEDEPTLQDMWASLLAASISPEFDSSMHPKYSEVLKQISPLEAELLNDVYEFHQENGYWIYANLDKVEKVIGVSVEDLQPFFANLDRLNLVRVTFGNGGYLAMNVEITPFLMHFMRRCTYGKSVG